MKSGIRSSRSFSASRGVARSVSRSSRSFKSGNSFYRSSRSPFRHSGRNTYYRYRTGPMTTLDIIFFVIGLLIFLIFTFS